MKNTSNRRKTGTNSIAAGLMLALLSSVGATNNTWAQSESDDCDKLEPSKQALCRLLLRCDQIEDDATRQRCYELAVEVSETLETPASDLVEETQEVVDATTDVVVPVPVVPVPDAGSVTEVAEETVEESTEVTRVRGFFQRVAGAVRGAAQRGKEVLDEQKTEEETNTYESVVTKTGRVDRTLFLVVLEDENLYYYTAEPENRMQVGQKVTVHHVKTWATDSYRITPHGQGTHRANRIPCEREYLVGTPKKRCEMMLDLPADHWKY